jgi:hypothetical protein
MEMMLEVMVKLNENDDEIVILYETMKKLVMVLMMRVMVKVLLIDMMEVVMRMLVVSNVKMMIWVEVEILIVAVDVVCG